MSEPKIRSHIDPADTAKMVEMYRETMRAKQAANAAEAPGEPPKPWVGSYARWVEGHAMSGFFEWLHGEVNAATPMDDNANALCNIISAQVVNFVMLHAMPERRVDALMSLMNNAAYAAIQSLAAGRMVGNFAITQGVEQ